MRAATTDREIAQAITSATLTHGGATWTLYGVAFLDWGTGQPVAPAGPLTEGRPVYVVGGAAGIRARVVPVEAFGSDDVFRFLQTLRVTGGETVDGIGAWVDNGKVYLDAVDYYSYAPTALRVASERGEQAVWDNRLGESIDVAEWFA